MIEIDGPIIFSALFLGFLIQTVSGFAGGLVALPILLFVLPIAESVALISIFTLTFSVIQICRQWRDIDRQIYLDLGLMTVLGVCIGSLLLSFGSSKALKKALGIFVILYLLQRKLKSQTLNITKPKAAALGLIGGFFAGLFSSGAPPFVIYVMNQYKDPQSIRANIIGILAITNFTRPLVLVSTGVLSLSILKWALWGLPAFVIALMLGEKAFQSMDKKVFINLVTAFLILSSLMLCLK